MRWSNPATWPNHELPAAGQDVTIPDSTTVVLDIATPALGAVTVRGTLIPDSGTVSLNAARVDVYGVLAAGSSEQPYTGHFTITLLERPGDTNPDTKGVTVQNGGDLELFGSHRVQWTHLNADAAAGATQIQLADQVDWRPGDRIVVAPSGFDYHQVDLAMVQSASATTVTLAQPLQYAHSGTIERVSGVSIDERAEVGLLTHAIMIQGDSASESNGHGGHVIVYVGGTAHVDGIEFYRMGQRGHMGRYPFHWHLAGSVPGQFIRNSSVWHSFNRCTTVHGTMDADVENNVCFDHEGHGFFVEDGNETGNTFRHNIATFARPGSLLKSDDNPASFWITNPDNTFEGNVAAGSPGIGFWITPPLHPTGPSATNAMWPAYMPLRRFDENVAHSTGDGLHAEEDHREEAPGFDAGYFPRVGGTPNGAPQTVVYSHYTAYATRRGFWVRGDHQRIESSLFADNAIGVMMGSAALNVEGALANSVVIGSTGNPLIALSGRSSGVLLYDGPITISHVSFLNFAATTQDAAIGGQNGLWVRVSPRFTTDHVNLVNARPVYLAQTPDDHYGFGSVRDLDGSLLGTPGLVAVPDAAFLDDPRCSVSADMNAAVCAVPYVAVGMRDASDLSATVISKDGAPMHTWTGSSSPDMSVTVPANHSYDFAPPRLTTTYRIEVDGLASASAGTWVTVSAPWTAATVTIATAGLSSTGPLPLVSSQAALDASTVASAFYDRAAGKVYVRVLAPVEPQVELWVRQ